MASWAVVLEPLAHGRARLIARSRVSRDWLAGPAVASVTPGKPLIIERIYDLLARLPPPLMLALAGDGHYLMESRMLRGIKHRAEQEARRGLATAGMPARDAAPAALRRRSGAAGSRDEEAHR